MDKKYYIIARLSSLFIALGLAFALWTYIRKAPTIEPETTSLSPDSTIDTSDTTTQSSEDVVQQVQPLAKEESVLPQKSPKKASSDLKGPAEQKQAPMNTHSQTTAASESKKEVPSNRTITVRNAIEKSMLGYKKFGTHYPTTFKITIGEKVLEAGESVPVEVKNNTLTVRYDFEFMNGYRNGAQEVIFLIKPSIETISLSFNWKSEHRLLIEEDKLVSIEEKDVPYQA